MLKSYVMVRKQDYYRKILILFSGNEILCSADGFFAGSNLIMNTGRMNHSNLTSEMKGMSKALNMSICLLICPEQMPLPMTYEQAWSPLNVLNIKRRYIPILQVVARKLDSLFWVSFESQIWNYYPEGSISIRLQRLL